MCITIRNNGDRGLRGAAERTQVTIMPTIFSMNWSSVTVRYNNSSSSLRSPMSVRRISSPVGGGGDVGSSVFTAATVAVETDEVVGRDLQRPSVLRNSCLAKRIFRSSPRRRFKPVFGMVVACLPLYSGDAFHTSEVKALARFKLQNSPSSSSFLCW